MGEQWVADEDVTAAGAPEPSFPAHAGTFITTCEMGRRVPPYEVVAGLVGCMGTSHRGRPGNTLVWDLESPTAGEPGMGGNWDGGPPKYGATGVLAWPTAALFPPRIAGSEKEGEGARGESKAGGPGRHP